MPPEGSAIPQPSSEIFHHSSQCGNRFGQNGKVVEGPGRLAGEDLATEEVLIDNKGRPYELGPKGFVRDLNTRAVKIARRVQAQALRAAEVYFVCRCHRGRRISYFSFVVILNLDVVACDRGIRCISCQFYQVSCLIFMPIVIFFEGVCLSFRNSSYRIRVHGINMMTGREMSLCMRVSLCLSLCVSVCLCAYACQLHHLYKLHSW